MINEFDQIRPSDICPDQSGVGRIIDFARDKRLQLRNQVATVIHDLLGYGKKYYDNWLESAQNRFIVYSQGITIPRPFNSLFEIWYVLNYRFHSDVSPIIEFYMVENEDLLEANIFNLLLSLKYSYLSIYEIIWSQNNTLLLRDIFTDIEVMTFYDFDVVNNNRTGTLLLARIVTVDYISLFVGRPVLIPSQYKRYLFDEINSTRIYEGEADFRTFFREFAEVMVGLVIDLSQDIMKNRVKYRCMALAGNQRFLVEKIVGHTRFSLLDRKEKWLKFIWDSGTGSFFRLYVGTDRIVAAAEAKDDLILAGTEIDRILGQEGSWMDGFRLIPEEDGEDLLIEIMHDKYIEEWLATPNIDLENMTPLLAMKDIRGRVLLENLLGDMEIMELRAVTCGGYFLPTSEIRTKLGLDQDRVKQEMLEPEAIDVKVKQNRSRQKLSTFTTDYLWVNEKCEMVAVYLFDLYNNEGRDQNRLAWLLYIWKEFSSIYQPSVTRVNVWAAALELALSREQINSVLGSPMKIDVSAVLVRRNSNLIIGHLKRFPFNSNLKPVYYPLWTEMDNRAKVEAYRDVWQRLQVFAHAVTNNYPGKQQRANAKFNEGVDFTITFWDESTLNTWQEFFNLYYWLSFKGYNYSTIANYFWEYQAKRYPPHLKTAAFNLMTSFTGVFQLEPQAPGNLVFEDVFTGCKYEVYGRIAHNVHRNIIPGTLVITRLVSLGERWLVDHPMFTLSADMREDFDANLKSLTEKMPAADAEDPDYLKTRGLLILKAYIKTMAELERSAVSLLDQPLEIQWRIADQLIYEDSCHLLSLNNRFQLLYKDENRNSYIWLNNGNNQGYDWGYVLAEGTKLLLCSPPGKDDNKFRKEIRRCFKVADIVVVCRELGEGKNVIQDLNGKLVSDLAGFLKLYPQLMPVLLRPDDLPDKEEEWLQGVFLYKLGSMIMKKLQYE